MPRQAEHRHFLPLGTRLRRLLDRCTAQQEPVTTSALPVPRQRSSGRLKRSASRPELEDGAEYAFPTAAGAYELREVVGQGSTSRVRLPAPLAAQPGLAVLAPACCRSSAQATHTTQDRPGLLCH